MPPDAPVPLLAVALIGLLTTSSVMVGASLGLFYSFPGKILAAILAFASGSLIAALAIELGFEAANELIRRGEGLYMAFLSVAGGFALGAVAYSAATLFLENRGAALRYPSRFVEYALKRKRQALSNTLTLLSQSDLLRKLPPEQMAAVVDRVESRELAAGEVVFRHGDPGDAIYVVARGIVEVLGADEAVIAELGAGQTFGEMALLTAVTRSATVRARTDATVLRLDRQDFRRLLAENPFLEHDFRRLIHERAAANLKQSGHAPGVWANIVNENITQISHTDEYHLLNEVKAGKTAGLAIVFGNILDTIPGCLVIGAKFASLETLSITLMLGMFLGGIPEAAASAAMLRRAGFSNRSIYALWSTVLVAGLVAAVAGKLLLGHSDSNWAILAEAVAGGAILALVTHAMIPEALHKGGSSIVLPAVAGFLFGLYFALLESGVS